MIDLSIKKLLKVKKDIRDAIVEKGVTIADDNNFEEYPKQIRKITGSGGGSVETSTLNNVVNSSSKAVSVGDKVFLNQFTAIKGDENYLTGDTPTYLKYLSVDGNFLYSANATGLPSYAQLENLSIKNDFMQSYTVNNGHYDFGPNGELLSRNIITASGSNTPEEIRDDKIYWKKYITYYHGYAYIGEDIYIIHKQDENKNYVAKVDLDSGEDIKLWNITDVDWESASNKSQCVAIRKNNKIYVYEFNKNIVIIIDESTDSVEIKNLNLKRMQKSDIRPVAVTSDHKFIMFTPHSLSLYSFNLIRCDSDIDLTELKLDDCGNLKLMAKFTENYQFFFNRFNQILSVQSSGSKKENLILQYIGCDEKNLPLFQEIKIQKPAKYSNFDFVNVPASIDGACTKLTYKLEYYSDRVTVIQALNDFSQFEIVDPYLCNSTSLQGVVLKNAESGQKTSVQTYKIDEAVATVKTNINAEIEIVGGVQ